MLAAAVTALALPPPAFGLVPDSWGSTPRGVVPEVELELWAAAAVDLTDAKLYAASLQPFTMAATAMTSAIASTDLVTKANHGYLTGDGPFQVTTGGTLPGGLAPLTNYWVIWIGANTFKVAASLLDALAGTAIDLTTDAVGAMTVTGIASQRVHWQSRGFLGDAGDGAISLDAQASYWTTRLHSARIIAYALVATLSDTIAVSAALTPRSDVG